MWAVNPGGDEQVSVSDSVSEPVLQGSPFNHNLKKLCRPSGTCDLPGCCKVPGLRFLTKASASNSLMLLDAPMEA